MKALARHAGGWMITRVASNPGQLLVIPYLAEYPRMSAMMEVGRNVTI
jgi:hypothetical protein